MLSPAPEPAEGHREGSLVKSTITARSIQGNRIQASGRGGLGQAVRRRPSGQGHPGQGRPGQRHPDGVGSAFGNALPRGW